MKEELWRISELWYRGVSKATYKLIPGVYREGKYNLDDAKNLANSFIHRAKGYLTYGTTIGKWEWYQIMQHHGLPTRLLDWTEGSLIALYFSLRKTGEGLSPCVWVLNPYELNLVTTNEEIIYYTDEKTRENRDEIVDGYLFDAEKLLEYPIALIPPYINERMSVQKSCFTVHGHLINGLEKLHEDLNLNLIQLRIDASNAISIKKDLKGSGITESTLFPDLEGLARELKETLI